MTTHLIPAPGHPESPDPLEARFRSAYAGLAQPDGVADVIRRGAAIRRARRTRRASVATAGVAAAAVVALSLSPLSPFGTSGGPVELVGFSVPSFPLSLDPVPEGLGAPHFWLEPDGRRGAAYPAVADSGTSDDGLFLGVGRERRSNLGERSGRTTVAGHDATWFVAPAEGGVEATLTLQWERRDDQWVTVTGSGTRATRPAVLDAATRLSDTASLVPLQVRLAPKGWIVSAYKDDTILSLHDPDSDDPTRSIDVQVNVHWDADFATATGARSRVDRTVNGRPAVLVTTSERQAVQARLPDGTTFVLQAPLDLSPDEVVRLAGAVSRP